MKLIEINDYMNNYHSYPNNIIVWLYTDNDLFIIK